MLFLWAQDAAGAAAVSGWASFGVAGLILAWLFFKHLPDKDRQIEKLLGAKDTQIEGLLAKKWQAIEKLTESNTTTTRSLVESHTAATQHLVDTFDKRLCNEQDVCERRHKENLEESRSNRDRAERHHSELMADHQRTHDENKETRHAIKGLTHNVALLVAVVKQQAGLRPDPAFDDDAEPHSEAK